MSSCRYWLGTKIMLNLPLLWVQLSHLCFLEVFFLISLGLLYLCDLITKVASSNICCIIFWYFIGKVGCQYCRTVYSCGISCQIILLIENFLTGKDKSVVLWSIQDYVSTLAAEPASTKSPGSAGANTKSSSKGGGSTDKPTESRSIGPRGIFLGHEDTVEDVQFCPSR